MARFSRRFEDSDSYMEEELPEEYATSEEETDEDSIDGESPEEPTEEEPMKLAGSLFNTVSILVGILAVLACSWLLFSLISWLKGDISHSLLLLGSGL